MTLAFNIVEIFIYIYYCINYILLYQFLLLFSFNLSKNTKLFFVAYFAESSKSVTL